MKKILQLASKLETFKNTLPALILEVIKSNESLVIDMNVEDQLFERGVDREEKNISNREPYRPITVSIKRQKGQPTSRVTTRDSGDFHESAFIKYGATFFEISFSDWKYGALVEKYGPIDGLTDENLKDLLINYIKPALIKKLRA